MFCMPLPEPILNFHLTETEDTPVVPMRKMYHKENLWRHHRDIDGWECGWMEVSAVVEHMLDRQKLAGTSWDGANLEKISDLRHSDTLSAGADRIFSMKGTILIVSSSWLTFVLFSWVQLVHATKLPEWVGSYLWVPSKVILMLWVQPWMWDPSIRTTCFFGDLFMDPWKGMEVVDCFLLITQRVFATSFFSKKNPATKTTK